MRERQELGIICAPRFYWQILLTMASCLQHLHHYNIYTILLKLVSPSALSRERVYVEVRLSCVSTSIESESRPPRQEIVTKWHQVVLLVA